MAEAETASTSTETGNGAAEKTRTEQVVSDLNAMVDRLEGRVKKLVDETGADALADGRQRIQENPITAVLMALGIGLLLGLILGSRRG